MELRPITTDGVRAALDKAHRYRLLNDSLAAESICLDVLQLEPANVEAIETYILALTDQFGKTQSAGLRQAKEGLARFAGDEYRSAYFHGLICERWAKAIMERGMPFAPQMAHEWITRALRSYEKAEKVRPAGNDDAILRWNTCVRTLRRHPTMKPAEVETYEPSFEDA
jgi:hypothetical protein